MNNPELNNIDPENHLSRRSLIKAAAWATPVIAFAAAAPLASASPADASVSNLFISQRRTGTYGGSGTWATASGPLIAQCTTPEPYLNVIDNSGFLGWSTGVITAGYTAGDRFTSLQFFTSTGTALALNDTITTATGTFTVTSITATTLTMSCPGVTISSATTSLKFPLLAAKVITQTAGGTSAERTITYATYVSALETGGTAGVTFTAR